MSEPTVKSKAKAAAEYIPWIIVCLAMILFVYGNKYYIETMETEIQRYMVIIAIAITCISIAAAVISLFFKKSKTKIASMLSLGIAISQLFIYSSSMGWSADTLKFIVNFAALIICTMIIVFSIDGLLDRKDTVQLLKPLTAVMVIITAVQFFYTVYSLYTFFSIPEIIEYFYNEICPIIVYITLLILLSSRKVMEKKKLKDIRLPLTLILAVVMLQYGLLYLLNFVPYTTYTHDLNNIAAYLVLIVFGLIFIIYRDVDKLTSVSVMMMGVGLFVILTNITKILSPDLYAFFIGVLMTVAGIGCIIMCILMYSGDKYNTTRLKVIMVILVAVAIIPVLITARLHPDSEYILSTRSDEIMSAFLLIAIYLALSEKPIQYRSVKQRMAYNVEVINNSICNDSNAYIFREELLRLLNEDIRTDLSEGPIEYEKKIELHINKTTATMTLQKWKGHDDLIGEISANKDVTIIQANRFTVARMVPDDDPEFCSSVTIYGRKGFFIKLIVLDPDEFIKTSKKRMILYRILGQSLTVKKDMNREAISKDPAAQEMITEK